MHSESFNIRNILSFLDEQCSVLPSLRADLETLIASSSASEETCSSMRKNFDQIISETESQRADILGAAGLQDHVDLKESVVTLNVGGHKFTTTLSTLRKYPETMLGAMFSGRHSLIMDADGCYFIDRDGTHFRYILNLLRSANTHNVVLELPLSVQEELKCECDYYGLYDLMFPDRPAFKKFSSFSCHNKVGQVVEVTQDKDGLFCVNEIPVPICAYGAANYGHCCEDAYEEDPDALIPAFKYFIKKKGGEILASQPSMWKFLCKCDDCNH